METTDVIAILIFFRDIELEIAFCKGRVTDMSDEYRVPHKGHDANAGFKGGGTSDPTARIALAVPDSVTAAIGQLEEYILELSALKLEIFKELNRLPYIQKAVIYAFYIEQMSARKICAHEHMSRASCLRCRKRGLEKLAILFSGNMAVKTFFENRKDDAP